MKYQVKHFKLSEFTCPDCGKVQISSALVFWLDMIRRAGGAPLVVSSGYRCKTRNALVNGAAMSRHMIGCAADIPAPKALGYNAFVDIAKRYALDGGEFVEYPKAGYIHFAVPREEMKSYWAGGIIEL